MFLWKDVTGEPYKSISFTLYNKVSIKCEIMWTPGFVLDKLINAILKSKHEHEMFSLSGNYYSRYITLLQELKPGFERFRDD